MDTIVVLLLEPDLWRRLGIIHVLKKEPEIKLIEEIDYNKIIALRRSPENLDPDVVMLSHILLIDFSLSIILKIKNLFSRAHILVHGYEANIEKVAEILIAGAKGYFLLSSRPQELVESLKSAGRGLISGPPEAIALTVQRLISLKSRRLTIVATETIAPRERVIINLLAKGWTNKEIANKLGVAEVTIKAHLSRLYKRFNVRSRIQLLRYAFERDLILDQKTNKTAAS